MENNGVDRIAARLVEISRDPSPNEVFLMGVIASQTVALEEQAKEITRLRKMLRLVRIRNAKLAEER